MFSALGYDATGVGCDWVQAKFGEDNLASDRAPRAICDHRITVTTVPRSKGLSADYVFLTHFDDTYYAKGGATTDDYVRSFLVGITRARNTAFLVSMKPVDPIILKWIEAGRIEKQNFLR